MVGGRRPLLPEILGQLSPVGVKSPIMNQYRKNSNIIRTIFTKNKRSGSRGEYNTCKLEKRILFSWFFS